jgi:uncharacterized protein YdaU (DUF1376 family)
MRNGLPYYKAYPRDFIEGTIGLPFEVKCAYRVLLDLIYMQGGRLPDDSRYISGLLGCTIRKWNGIRNQLVDLGKIQVIGEFLANYRADKELETLSKLQDKQSENRSCPNKIKDLQKPRSDQPEPEPEEEEKEASEDDLFKAESLPKKQNRELEAIEAGFEEWWGQIWPSHQRKAGKADCRKVYTHACQGTHGKADKIAAADLNAATRRYIASVKDRDYLKGPLPWLRLPGWEAFMGESDPSRPMTYAQRVLAAQKTGQVV